MREEIQVAASWWTKEIKKKYDAKTNGPEALEKFHASLADGLVKRCTGHWHVEDPMKGSIYCIFLQDSLVYLLIPPVLSGCAYRSLSYDSRVDPLLRKAAEEAGIKQSIEELLSGSRYIMFINPGIVFSNLLLRHHTCVCVHPIAHDTKDEKTIPNLVNIPGISVVSLFGFGFTRDLLYLLSTGAVKLRNVAFCSATPEVIYQKEIKMSEFEEESGSKRTQSSPPSNGGIPRGSPISNFVQKNLSMGNSNYEHINRYLKPQQILVPPTM
uniref:Anti-proliferative protein domain-containing protein n=1 Tax=Lotharella globosa TaxID=91324 RepID=A0A7S4DF20_9EUKA